MCVRSSAATTARPPPRPRLPPAASATTTSSTFSTANPANPSPRGTSICRFAESVPRMRSLVDAVSAEFDRGLHPAPFAGQEFLNEPLRRPVFGHLEVVAFLQNRAHILH